MRVSGSYRPTTTHNETAGKALRVQAEEPDWETARAALYAQVPDGHQLLHIIVGG